MRYGHTAKEDSRVYLLGAGASHFDTLKQPLPLPLAVQFFENKYLEEYWRYKSDLVDYTFDESNLHTVLKHSFAFSRGKSTKINVEDVFSFLEVYLSTYTSNSAARRILEEARRELLIYIIHSIRAISKEQLWGDTLHNLILKSLRKLDSVFTFNWDVLIDHSKKLDVHWKIREPLYRSILNPFNGPLTNEDSDYEWSRASGIHRNRLGLVLRLHGSVGLAHCVDLGCPGNATPFELYPGTPFAESLSCSFCGSELKSMLLPPFVHKTYRSNRFINLQARLAAERIRSATELVIVGYSFPESDYEAMTLVRLFRPEPDSFSEFVDHRPRKVVIVDPKCESVEFKRKLSRLFATTPDFRNVIEIKKYDSVEKFISEDLKPRVDIQFKEYKAEIERKSQQTSGGASTVSNPKDWWEE